MKVMFRLGYILIPCLLFLSQTAYSGGFRSGSRGHPGVVDLGLPGASRAPASVSQSATPETHQRLALLGDSSALPNLRNLAVKSDPASWALLSENLRENAQPAPPYEGSGIGARAAVFHFTE